MKIVLDFYNKIFNNKLMNIASKILTQKDPNQVKNKNLVNNNLNLLQINFYKIKIIMKCNMIELMS